MKGIMMHASADWLNYHRQYSVGKRVAFYASPKKETHSYQVLFCVNKEIKTIDTVGTILAQKKIHQDKAWAEYSNALGAQTEVEWRRQAEPVLEHAQATYQGEILVIELGDFRFFPDPIDPKSVGNGKTNFRLMKKVGEGDTTRLLKIFEENPDLMLAQAFGLNPDDKIFIEGKAQMRLHLVKERNPHLVNQAKRHWKLCSNGKLRCEICGFSFLEIYGIIGDGFIEAHHRVPIASLNEDTPVKIADLAPVCSNCHSMIHRHQPFLTIEQLKQAIQKS